MVVVVAVVAGGPVRDGKAAAVPVVVGGVRGAARGADGRDGRGRRRRSWMPRWRITLLAVVVRARNSRARAVLRGLAALPRARRSRMRVMMWT